MRRVPACLLVVMLFLSGTARPAVPAEKLVLIVSAASHVEQLDSLQIRKLFLGMTVAQNGNRLRPLLNEADSMVKEVFLQNVVAMTSSTYDRRLLRLALQNGLPPPIVYNDTTLLLNSVAADPAAVSFAWYRDVALDTRFKILRVLWHD